MSDDKQEYYRQLDRDPTGYWWIPPGDSPYSRRHRCPLPSIRQIPDIDILGSLWECNECRRYWLVRDTDQGPDWRPISERRANKLTTKSLAR